MIRGLQVASLVAATATALAGSAGALRSTSLPVRPPAVTSPAGA